MRRGMARGRKPAPAAASCIARRPLLSLVKSLNDYSNNVFKPLADAAGGIAAVESLRAQRVPEDDAHRDHPGRRRRAPMRATA